MGHSGRSVFYGGFLKGITLSICKQAENVLQSLDSHFTHVITGCNTAVSHRFYFKTITAKEKEEFF